MQNQLKVEQSVYRKRAKRRIWQKKRNYFLNCLPASEKVLYSGISNALSTGTTLSVPHIFHTGTDINKVLKFISRCKAGNVTRHSVIILDFKKICSVNAGALSLLLSVIQDLTDLKVKVKGNLPSDGTARQEFIDSGFLEYFKDIKGGAQKSTFKNRIIVKGHDTVNQMKTGAEILEAMNTVFGSRSHNPALQGALIEMMANSVNHAFPEGSDWVEAFFEPFVNNKRWYFSVYHNHAEKKVHFSFIDNGAGIISTIKRGNFAKVVEFLTGTDILRNAFDGQYRSSTSQPERGLGLPTVKKVEDTKAVKNLKVVTNDYEYDFDNQTGTKLTSHFEGTCYFWVLDNTCEYANT